MVFQEAGRGGGQDAGGFFRQVFRTGRAIGTQGDGAAQAHRLFTALRELDKAGARVVYARCPASSGVSMAVYNRLLRAAAFRVVEV